MIDTHSHIYDAAFEQDRDCAIVSARSAGVQALLLPAIDSQSHSSLLETVRAYPDYCFPMIGLHPTSVNDIADYRSELDIVRRLLASAPAGRFYGVGEIGLDLYWDRRREKEQIEVFCSQIELALQYDLPVAVHTRSAMPQMLDVLGSFRSRGLRGVMHAFSGTLQDYRAIKSCGDFLFGIGGTVTYKKSESAALVAEIPLSDIVLETDCPYLAPVPFRGKRNQSAYITYVCEKVAQIKGVAPESVAEQTTLSARRMFGI